MLKALMLLAVSLILSACPEDPPPPPDEPKDPPKENQVETTTDAGSSDATIKNPTSDAGNEPVPVTDGGSENVMVIDAGGAISIEVDSGTSAAETTDAGPPSTAETDAGNEAVTSSDAGMATTPEQDAGTSNTTAPDAGIIIAECVEGNAQLGTTPCGHEGLGFLAHLCTNGQWQESTLCVEASHENQAHENLNLLTGYAPSEWDYDQATAPANGVYGWSYYLRAFDLIRDTPVSEIGWGQWSKPAAPADGLSVCGLSPRGFVCEEEPMTLSPELQNCGYQDYSSLEGCQFWCCGEEDKCGVRGSIEGGMGYWMYTLETPHVKWMLPGGTNANYEVFGGTLLHDRPQECTKLGGAVRVSNRLLVPNDFVSFEGDTIDGFLGYMLSRTPIGKRGDTDEANYWTIVMDAANYSGPVMYISNWFWDSRINWHPESVSWSDPRALIGYIAQGFEGRIGSMRVSDADGNLWHRTNRWAFPQDTRDGAPANSSTLFTGHSQYHTDWAAQAMEPILAGTSTLTADLPSAVREAASAYRTAPSTCHLPEDYTSLRLEKETEDGEITWSGFGVGDVPTDMNAEQYEADLAGCHMRLALDPNKLDCSSTPGWCEGDRYLKEGTDGSTTTLDESDVPNDVKAALELRPFEPTKRNDGNYLQPAATETVCFDTPGPASDQLYCTRTQSGTWIGYRWYRFVDQPELNQVFASLPESERDAAKCYMQARIERLHEAQDTESVSPWFEPPQGAHSLPADKVAIESALLLTPPAGFEKGFVPIPVVERHREKPEGCQVYTGPYTEEPAPLPAEYYDGHAWSGGGYDIEMCAANDESGSDFSYLGTVYPYAISADQTQRTPYAPPLKENVGSTIDATPVSCGLASDL